MPAAKPPRRRASVKRRASAAVGKTAASRKASARKGSTKKASAKQRAKQPAATKKTGRKRAPSAPSPVSVSWETAELHFSEATIAQGHASEPDVPLPTGATHTIVGRDESDRPILKRKRFSLT